MKSILARRFVPGKIILAGLVSVLFAIPAFGQLNFGSDQPDGGGSAPLPSDVISDAQREMIWAEINKNRARLQREGK